MQFENWRFAPSWVSWDTPSAVSWPYGGVPIAGWAAAPGSDRSGKVLLSAASVSAVGSFELHVVAGVMGVMGVLQAAAARAEDSKKQAWTIF